MRAGNLTSLAARPRTGLWQPQQPTFWLLLVLVLTGFGLLIPAFIRAEADVATWAVALMGCAIQAALLLWVVFLISRVRGKPRLQPRSLRNAALVAGAVAATGLAGVINSLFGDYLGAYGLTRLSAAISAPIAEDALRMTCLIVILALAATRRLTILDGVVYGFLVGAGFELMENVLYAARSEDLGGTIQSILLRTLMGFGLHALWTATAGGVLAYVWSRAQAGLSTRWWIMVPAYVLPMTMHIGWDAPGVSAIPVMKYIEWALLYLITLVAFIVVLWWGRRDAKRNPETVGVEAVGVEAVSVTP